VESTLSTIAWGQITQQIAKMGQEAINAYQEQQRAMSGLSAIARAYGQDQAAVEQAVRSLTDNGILPLTSAATALRNLLSTGLSLDQAVELVQVFEDRAAVGRAESISFAQAVENLSQAFKTESSELGDLSGMTENYSQILEVGAQTLGKSVNELTQAERAQAKYLGVLQLSQPYIGSVATVMDDLSSKQAKLQSTTKEVAATLGDALAPVSEQYTEIVTEAAEALGRWIKYNDEAARSLTLAVGGATAAVTAVTALTAAIRLLSSALGGGWIALAVTGVSALAGAVGGLTVAQKTHSVEASRNATEVYDLMRKYEALRRVVDDATSSVEDKELAMTQLKNVTQQLIDLQPVLAVAFDDEMRLIGAQTDKYNELRAAVEAVTRAKLQQKVVEAEQNLASLQATREQIAARYDARTFSGFLRQLTDPELQGYVTPEQVRARSQELAAADPDMRLVEAEIRVAQAELEAAKLALANMDKPLSATEVMSRSTGRNVYTSSGISTSGSTTSTTDPVAAALRALEHQRTMGYIDTQGYIAGLEQIKEAYAVTADQLMDIDERIKRARDQMTADEIANAEAARKAKIDAATKWMDWSIRMGFMSTEQEIDRINEILQTYELTEDEVMDLVARRYEAEQRLSSEAAKSEEERVRNALALINHRRAMGEVSLQEEIEALEAHLEQEQAYYETHTDELWDIQERLYDLREQARQEDLRAEEEAARKIQQAWEDAQKRVAQAISALRDLLREEQERDLDRLERRYSEEEARQQQRIDQLQEELDALRQRNKEEDRALKLAELRKQLEEAEASGPLEEFITATGERIWRNRQAEELRERIAEEERQQERERQEERLQDQIRAEQDRLQAMRESHQEALADRRRYWSDLLDLDDDQLIEMVQQTDLHFGDWYSTMEDWLENARVMTEHQADAITDELDRITREIRDAQDALDELNRSGVLVVPEAVSLPASYRNTVNVGGVSVNVTVQGGSSPQATAAAVAAAVPGAVTEALDLAAARSGARFGLRLY